MLHRESQLFHVEREVIGFVVSSADVSRGTVVLGSGIPVCGWVGSGSGWLGLGLN